jgi:N-acetylglucosamine-6-sulfatase
VKAPEDMQGRSLVPVLRGAAPDDWRTSFLIEYNSDTVFPRVRNMGYRAIRTSRWKYIRYMELEGMDELYDLLHDPYEMTNLAGNADIQPILETLGGELDRLITDER